MFSRHLRSLALLTACGSWLFLVLMGSAALWRYKQTPGDDAVAPSQWPADSTIVRTAERPTLLLFVHPHCVCSRATIEGLARLMASAPPHTSAHVVMFRPHGSTAGWAKGGLWQAAAAIPGVSVREDEGGVEARRFRGETSGHAVLYDRRGQRVFDGGITPSRGHAGDSAGLAMLRSLLHDKKAELQHTQVFGCRIRNRNDDTMCGDKPCAR